jgi:hypothetical protein
MISTTRVAVAHSDIRCGLCGSPYSAHNWTLSGSTLQGACPAESESELRRLGYTLRADQDLREAVDAAVVEDAAPTE